MKAEILVQERFSDSAWRIAIVCCLCNRSRGKDVGAIADELFCNWPSPTAILQTRQEEIERVIRPLGLSRRKTQVIRRLSREFLNGTPIEECHGVGRYALDSIRMFHDGDLSSPPASGDPRLSRRYKELVA